MLMKTDTNLLKEIEFFDEMDKPSLQRLSYLLRHPAMWPPGFEWDFNQCPQCAMGLANAYWNLSAERYKPFDWYKGMMIRTFGISGSTVSELFGYGVSITNGHPTEISPKMVADQIDKYLKDCCA